jgi:hypothetical protein
MVASRCVLKYSVSNGVSSCQFMFASNMYGRDNTETLLCNTVGWFITPVIPYSVTLLYGPGRIVRDEEVYTI